MDPIAPMQWGLVYAGYLTWLLAGAGDFLCHRRTSLATTSGIAESSAHLVQLGLLGLAFALGLLLQPSVAMLGCIGLLVVAHAIVGYLDTRTAFASGRVILPVEQHLHSILDMAPIIGFAGLVAWTWPLAVETGFVVRPRDPAAEPWVWAAILAPATGLSVVPALLEFRSAWKARRRAGIGLRHG